jgi:sugar O-acyltransferase (sialic acid O-acetyltransferase NeuD family)
MSRLVIYGAGGFGRELVRHARHYMAGHPEIETLVFASDSNDQVGSVLLGLSIISPRHFLPDDLCIPAVGSPGSAAIRRAMAAKCPGFAILVSPTAIVDEGIVFRDGSVVCDYAMFTGDQKTVIGSHFHCNFHSHVGHDCIIGDFVTLAPKVSVNGNVHIGDDVYVGSGAQIRSGCADNPIRIGSGSIVGMGAVVTKDVPPNVTVVGNPARIIKAHESRAA